MGNYVICMILQRLLWPLTIVACSFMRPVGISLAYLLMFFMSPFIPIATSKNIKGSVGAYFIVWIALSFLLILAHIGLQIAIVVVGFDKLIASCSFTEIFLRHLGFISLINLAPLAIIEWVVPEILTFLISVILYIALKKLVVDISAKERPNGATDTEIEEGLQQYPNKGEANLPKQIVQKLLLLGPLVSLLTLLFAAVLRPSVPGGFYFVVFLASGTYWACYKKLQRGFGIILQLVMLVLVLHSFAIFTYQTPWPQQFLLNSSLPARLAGLEPLFLSDCINGDDIRVIDFNDSVHFDSYLNPISILLCYYILALTSKGLISKKLVRRSTRSKKQKVPNTENIALDSLSEDAAQEELQSTILDDIWLALQSCGNFLYINSYVLTSIIMMVWSIVYHSWLTFILLIWANILWMIPNQRKTMLTSSPFIVIYAELLLIAQYIYGMDLTDEQLPSAVEVKGINLRQIGLVKPTEFPCAPLMLKTFFTLMFWITMRQLFREAKENKQSTTLADMIAPLQITVGAATTDLAPKLTEENKSRFLDKFGEILKSILVKLWIWILVLVIFLCGITGQRMTGFRICYMALFLFFVLAFQLSWRTWTRIMYGYWLVLIVYAMTILILIYTYQFDRFDEHWKNYFGISFTLQKDIGLEKYKIKDLFLHLVNPTAIVIMTVLQVHYFHAKFLESLKLSKSSVRKYDEEKSTEDAGEGPSGLINSENLEKVEATKNVETTEKHRNYSILKQISRSRINTYVNAARTASKNLKKFFWIFLDVHLMKIIVIIAFGCCLTNVCVLHISFAFLAVISVVSKRKMQIFLSRLISLIMSILLLAKMIYQVDYFNHKNYDAICEQNSTASSAYINNAEWFGLSKITDSISLARLLRGYIIYLIVVTLHAIVIFRHGYRRTASGMEYQRSKVIFEDVKRSDAETNLIGLLKYLFNFCYYKFGFEITSIVLVAAISYRQDILAIIYALWLCILFILRRSSCTKIWPIFQAYVAIVILLQYLVFVGLPPELCMEWPWHNSPYINALESWAMVPGPHLRKQTTKLMFDFILLICIYRQHRVFTLEKKFINAEYPGGSNKSIVNEIDNLDVTPLDNPVPDYISNVRNWLDILKISVLSSFFWLSLAVIFLAGTNIISLFSIGYLIGSFIFLWQGTDFYLRPVRNILKWWYILMAYNVMVITMKTFLQIGGCFFLSTLEHHACWFVHLFGVSCFQDAMSEMDELNTPECYRTSNQYGLTWDAICFAFLIFQLRIFKSYYFHHIINDTKATTTLASRGAELIEDLRDKQIEYKKKHERDILRKLKRKMEKIRAKQEKMLRQSIDRSFIDETDGSPMYRRKLPKTHTQAIRAGDYYMFDDLDDQIDLDILDEEDDYLAEENTATRRSRRKTLMEVYKDYEKQRKDQMKTKSRELISSTSGTEFKEYADKSPTTDEVLSSKSTELKDESKSVDEAFTKDEVDKTPVKEIPESEDKTIERGFLWKFFNSLLVTFIVRLNRISRNYRYVMRILETEKKLLKESKSFGVGVRAGTGNIWTPFKYIRKLDTNEDEPQTVLHKAECTKQSDVTDIDTNINTDNTGETGETHITHREEEIDDYDESFSSRQHSLFIELLMAAWYAILANSDLLCYLAAFINQVAYASVLSFPLPLMIFLWGTLTIPRPTKTFWITLIAYTQTVVLIKCIFQFKIIWFNQGQYANQPVTPASIIGIQYSDGYGGCDLVLLLMLFFHRFMLKSQGLWKSEFKADTVEDGAYLLLDEQPRIEETDESTSQEQKEIAVVTKDDKTLILARQNPEDSVDPDEICVHVSNFTEEPGNYLPAIVKVTSAKYCSPIVDFLQDLLHKARLPTDVYAYMFLCDFINFFVLLFGFSAFDSQRADGGVQTYLEENRVPVSFLVMLIMQFVLIIVDRALYLRKAIKYRLGYHLFIVIGIHIWMFFVIPSLQERAFNSQAPTVIFYLVKCVYFILSSYQLRCGYPSRISGNLFTKGYSIMNMLSFRIYMAIPLLYELRTVLDWVCTNTTMTLFDWLKMEDIFAEIYCMKCSRQMEADLPVERGVKKGIISKIIMGGGLIFLLTFLIWGPFVIFALSSAVGISNVPYDVSISLRVGPYEPVYEMSAQDSSIHKFDKGMMEVFKSAYQNKKAAMTLLSDYDYSDVAAMVLGTSSASLWGISPPDKERMMDDLEKNRTLTCRFRYEISRKSFSKEHPATTSAETIFELTADHPGRSALISMLQGNSSEMEVKLEGLLPKFLKVKSNGDLKTVPQLLPVNIDYRDVKIKLFLDNSTNKNAWWQLNENCNDTYYQSVLSKLPLAQCDSKIVIYTFSDKLFPSVLSIFTAGGIIGMYTTIVLVGSRLLRSFIMGSSRKVMFEELPYVDRILQLCLDVYLVREAMEFSLEEDLFAKLLFLYRSPETMIKWTRPKDERADDEAEEYESKSSSRRKTD